MVVLRQHRRRYFYPRSPCGERRYQPGEFPQCHRISIHALLAESDKIRRIKMRLKNISIHALLAESDPRPPFSSSTPPYFYPRSPCGERQQLGSPAGGVILFLSTLSLRRATFRDHRAAQADSDFYPRSPCGERRIDEIPYQRQIYQFLSTLSLRRATRRHRRDDGRPV